jgi:hypothetical protein
MKFDRKHSKNCVDWICLTLLCHRKLWTVYGSKTAGAWSCVQRFILAETKSFTSALSPSLCVGVKRNDKFTPSCLCLSHSGSLRPAHVSVVRPLSCCLQVTCSSNTPQTLYRVCVRACVRMCVCASFTVWWFSQYQVCLVIRFECPAFAFMCSIFSCNIANQNVVIWSLISCCIW